MITDSSVFYDNGDLFGAPRAFSVAMDGTDKVTHDNALWAGAIREPAVGPEAGAGDVMALLLLEDPGNPLGPGVVHAVDPASPTDEPRRIGDLPLGLHALDVPPQIGNPVIGAARDAFATPVNADAIFLQLGDEELEGSLGEDVLIRLTETPDTNEQALFFDC